MRPTPHGPADEGSSRAFSEGNQTIRAAQQSKKRRIGAFIPLEEFKTQLLRVSSLIPPYSCEVQTRHLY
jgi:hypothetical protein